MVWKRLGNALFFHEQGINVTLKPQSDPTASFVVDGYTEAQKEILRTENQQDGYQVALYDAKGIEYWIDQAERLNAYGFNKFKVGCVTVDIKVVL